MFFLFGTWRGKPGPYRRKSRGDAFPNPHDVRVHRLDLALIRPRSATLRKFNSRIVCAALSVTITNAAYVQ
jgi:hypothetical protein